MTTSDLPVADPKNNYFPFHDGHVHAHREYLERLKKQQEDYKKREGELEGARREKLETYWDSFIA